MERYYDAHLYFTDWGARRLMLRLDRELLSPAVVEEYLIDESVDAWVTGGRIILDFTTEDYEGDFDLEHDPLPGLIGIRAELAAGDHRPLYLAWLAALTSGEEPPGLKDEDPEPPVPPDWQNSAHRSVHCAIICAWTRTCSTSWRRDPRRWVRRTSAMADSLPGLNRFPPRRRTRS